MKKYVMADMTFDTTRRRDQARTRVLNEATTRGLIAESFDAEYSTGAQLPSGAYPGGCWVVASAAVPTLRACYWHANPDTVDLAADDLRAWLDSNGKLDGYVGTVTQD